MKQFFQPDFVEEHIYNRGSISSGPQLAMDAGGTTDDGEAIKGDGELEMSIAVQPTYKGLVETTGIGQFLTNLDTMDEHLESSEHLPFEGIEEKREILQVHTFIMYSHEYEFTSHQILIFQDFVVELDRGERLVQSQQMIMGIEESEHIYQRITNLRAQINDKRKELDKRHQKLSTLDALFQQCETMLTKLGATFQSIKKSRQQEGFSMPHDVEEQEASQLRLEDQLPRIAMRLQQCQNRLENIAPRLSSMASETLQKRLQQIALDFSEYTGLIRDQRQKLEVFCFR